MTGYKSKKAAAQAKTIDQVNWVDHEPNGLVHKAQAKVVVTDLDGHVVRGVRKPKKVAAQDKYAPSDPFERWWYYEGSAPPYTHHDCEEHTKRMCQIAWNKGAYVAAQPAQEPVAWITPDGEGFRIRFSAPTNDVPLGWDALYTTPPATQPTQEPVAYLCKPDQHGLFDIPTPDKACTDCFPVYAAPPQPAQEPVALECTYGYSQCQALAVAQQKRPWVGLTDEDMYDCFSNDVKTAMKNVEQTLKEKNT